MTITETERIISERLEPTRSDMSELFLDAYISVREFFGAQDRRTAPADPKLGRAVICVLKLAAASGANLEEELRRKVVRNRRRRYERVNGVWTKYEDMDADVSAQIAMSTLSEFQKEAYANKVAHNFNITDIRLEFCLIYDELGEAVDAYRRGLDSLGEELADVMIYILGLAEILGMDAQTEAEALLAAA